MDTISLRKLSHGCSTSIQRLNSLDAEIHWKSHMFLLFPIAICPFFSFLSWRLKRKKPKLTDEPLGRKIFGGNSWSATGSFFHDPFLNVEIPGNLLTSYLYIAVGFLIFLPKKALLNISSCSQVSEFEIPSYKLEKKLKHFEMRRLKRVSWDLMASRHALTLDACSSCV